MQSETSPFESGEMEVAEVISAEKLSEAAASEVVQAVPGVVVAREVEAASQECLGEEKTQEPPLHKNGRLKHVIECMLFVSTEPLSSKQLADALDTDQETIDEAVSSLQEHLDAFGGLQLMRLAGGYQLCTRPEYADYCALILQPARKKLSKAALETLAIIAYRQPCTVPEIEAVRGVSVDGVVKTLMDRGLVKEAGRKHAPGRPVLFETTPEFLEYFGLDNVSELPDIDGFAADAVAALNAQREMLLGQPAESAETADDS